MNTSIYITHHRNRTRNRRWRRGLRILLAMILLMCLLSACVVPVAAQTLGADTPPEMTESADVVMELSDSGDSIGGIISQDGGEEIDYIGELEGEPANESTIEPTTEPTEPADTVEGGETAAESTASVSGNTMPAASSDVEEPSEPVETAEAPISLSNTEPNMLSMVDNAVMLSSDAPMVAANGPVANAAGDTTWQEDYQYYTRNGNLVLNKYKRTKDPNGNQDLVVYATATVKGVTYNVQVSQQLYEDARYIKSVRFEDGVGISDASIQSMFRECFSLESVEFRAMDTTDLQLLCYMFYNCVNLRSVDMSKIDTSQVTSMEEMFKNCYRLESVKIGTWDTAKCYNMWYMFADCMNLRSLDISGWNTYRVKGIGYTMDGMFSVGLEELTVGAQFYLGSDASGLLGTWTDGTNTYTAEELERYLAKGNHAGTYRRISLGGSRSQEVSREQETLSQPEGYKATDTLESRDKKDVIQRNGQISNSNQNADGQLVKTAEWTDQEAGTAAIDLTYAVPSQGGARAVYACGTCNVHGFGADVMIIQLLELLDQYDYVDVLTTSSQYWKYEKSDFLATAREVTFTLSAADGRDANYSRLRTMLTPDFSNADNYNIVVWNTHASGAILLSYLGEYLQENKPAAIYVSFDGSRAFAEDDAVGHRSTVMPLLYGVQPGDASLSATYDDLKVDEAAMQTLAEYQRDGRYYVCICDASKFKLNVYNYCKAYYDYREDRSSAEGHESRLLCYASMALANPYYYVNNHDDLVAYLELENAGYQDIKSYKSLMTVGQPIINYGASFTSQGVQYVSAPLTITDTVADGLEIDQDNISVKVTLQGVEIENKPEIQVTVNEQDVRVYLSEVSLGEIVSVHIPVRLAGDAQRFCTDEAAFKDTNQGSAKVVTAAGKTVETDSPELFKGTFQIITEVIHGTITDPITDIPIGEDREVTYAPDEGYHLESVTVDGVDADIEDYEDSYAFLDITENHAIKVVYAIDEVPEEPTEPENPDDPKAPEQPDDPVEPKEPTETEDPDDPTEPEDSGKPVDTKTPVDTSEPEETTRRIEHHRTVNHTTENYKTINTIVTNETVANTAETPEIAAPEAVDVVVEAAATAPGPATGDNTQMMLWLSLAIAATLALLGWIAFQVRQMDME